MTSPRSFFLCILCAISILLACAGGSAVKLPVVKDTGLWYYRGHAEYDFGAVEPLFVEGAHNAALLGFDVSRAEGSEIRKATLWLYQAGEQELITLVVSTIAADWIEGAGNGSAPDPSASCAAWVKIDPQSGDTVRWAGPQSDVTDVIMASGNTLRAEVNVTQRGGGWQTVDIPLDIAHALVNGESYGLVLVDGKGQLRNPDDSFINKYFNSRDSGRHAPYLEVELAEPAEGIPAPPSEVKVEADLPGATFTTGGASIAISTAGDSGATFYEVRFSSVSLDADAVDETQAAPRYLIPRIEAGREAIVKLGRLSPQSPLGVAVRSVNKTGLKSDWVFTSGETSAALALPELADPKRPDIGGAIRVWVCPLESKVNPVNGRLLEDNPTRYGLPGDGDYDYMYSGYLWDAAGRRVTLDVPRGGTAAFQVVVEPKAGSIDGVSLRAGWSSSPAGAGRFPVRVFRNWYVRSRSDNQWYAEVAVPHAGDFSIPWQENGVEGQRNQSFTVEFYVPRESRAGRYTGEVVVGARGLLARRITVEVNVHQAEIPEKLPFISEMNSYGPVGSQYGLADDSDEYFEVEEQYYRLAQEHLTVINQLSTRQNGAMNAVGAPELEGEGEDMRISDWSAWDRRWGRYLDGSAFEGMDRRAPVPVMYLPFFENWPASLEKYYRFSPDDTSYVGMVNEHALEAPPIEQAFDPAYEQAWVGVLRQFADHIDERGWKDTEFQIYLNNKYYWKRKDANFSGDGSSWWLLDEPYHWEDFKAIAWYGSLVRRALEGREYPNIVHRIDVSRPHLSFGLWDDLRAVYYVSPFFYTKNAWLREHAARCDEQIRNYGSFHNLEESSLTATAWPLKAWLGGGNGLLPWQTIASDHHYLEFANTAIFYPGVRFGIRGPLASLRLKAMREGTELATLLALLAESRGWNPQQAAMAVGERLELGGTTLTEFLDDAGRLDFARLRPEHFAALKRDILLSLDQD